MASWFTRKATVKLSQEEVNKRRLREKEINARRIVQIDTKLKRMDKNNKFKSYYIRYEAYMQACKDIVQANDKDVFYNVVSEALDNLENDVELFNLLINNDGWEDITGLKQRKVNARLIGRHFHLYMSFPEGGEYYVITSYQGSKEANMRNHYRLTPDSMDINPRYELTERQYYETNTTDLQSPNFVEQFLIFDPNGFENNPILLRAYLYRNIGAFFTRYSTYYGYYPFHPLFNLFDKSIKLIVDGHETACFKAMKQRLEVFINLKEKPNSSKPWKTWVPHPVDLEPFESNNNELKALVAIIDEKIKDPMKELKNLYSPQNKRKNDIYSTIAQGGTKRRTKPKRKKRTRRV